MALPATAARKHLKDGSDEFTVVVQRSCCAHNRAVRRHAIRIALQCYALTYKEPRFFFFVGMKNRTVSHRSCIGALQGSVVLLCLFVICVTVRGQTRIAGIVSDQRGASIAEASVEFASGPRIVRTRTDERGEFAFATEDANGTLTVHAAGFETVRITLDGKRSSEQLQIKLEPAGVIERIVISADDERIPITPVSQYAIGQREIAS